MENEHTSFSRRPAQSSEPGHAAQVVRDDSVLGGALGFVALLSGGKMTYSGYPASWWLAMVLVCVAALVVTL